MFETLIGLPLFRGVSRDRMASVVGMAKFHFLKHDPDSQIVHSGNKCSHLLFLLNGSVRVNAHTSDGKLSVSYTLRAPEVIAPEFLFGRTTAYPCDVVTAETVNILQISKADYIQILNTDQVFMFNYLNYLSSRAQMGIESAMTASSAGVDARLAAWALCLTQPNATDITIACTGRELHSIFGTQRATFLRVMNILQNQGYITYTEQEIKIADRKGMTKLLTAIDTTITRDQSSHK